MFRYSLYARPSFIEGAGRVADLGATLNEYNYTLTPEQADMLALMSDWLDIGADLLLSIEKYEKSSQKEIIGSSD